MQRKAYLDNLRWACILLLIPYHAAMAWNCWGEGNYILLGSDRVLSSFVAAISPWHTPLLFVLAGMSANYARLSRSPACFVKERICKLLIPFLTGILVVMPVLAFFADKANCGYSGGFFGHYRVFWGKWTDLTGYDGGFGVGHLWFLLYLFVISIAGLGLDRFFGTLHCKSVPECRRVPCAVLLVMLSMLLIPVQLGRKSILTYLLLYLAGYYAFSDKTVMKSLSVFWRLFLSIWLISTALYVYLLLWSAAAHGLLTAAAMYISGSFGILTLLSFGTHGLNHVNRVTRLLTSDSFVIYLFHFVWVVVFEYALFPVVQNTAALFGLSVCLALIATIVTSEIVRRCPVLRRLSGGKAK